MLVRSISWIAATLLLMTSAAAAPAGFSTYELLRLKDIATMSLSPDGSRLAFITRQANPERNTYDNELHVIDLKAGAEPRFLGRVDPAVAVLQGFIHRTLQWADSGRLITYISDLDGRPQVWAWNVAGGPPHRISQAAADIVSHRVLSDGRRVVCAVFSISGSVEQRELLRRQANTEGMVYAPPTRWGDLAGEAGVERYVARRLGARFEYGLSDLTTGAWRSLTEEEVAQLAPGFSGLEEMDRHRLQVSGALEYPRPPPQRPDAVSSGHLSADGRFIASTVLRRPKEQRESVILLEHVDRQETRDWYRALESGISLLGWGAKDEGLYFHQHRYHESQGAVSGIYRLRVGTADPEAVFETHEAINRGAVSHDIGPMVYDRANAKAIFLLSNATRANRIVLLDLATGRLREIYDPNPWLAGRKLPSPTLLAWTNKYGVKAFAHLVKPLDYRPGRRYPLVLVTYNAFGFLRGGTGDEYPIWPLAANGFAVLALDKGEAIMTWSTEDELGLYGRYRSALATVDEAMRAASQHDFVDLTKAAYTGLSYSADTGWYILSRSNYFKAAIFSDSAALDSFSSSLRGARYDGSYSPTAQVFGVPIYFQEDEKRWREVGTSHNARNITAALLVNDADEEFYDGLGTTNTLLSLGKAFELIVYPNAGHNINQPAQRYSIYNRNIDWLKFWLMDREDPSPQKVPQYSRWRVLKEQQAWNERLRREGKDPNAEFLRILRSIPQRSGRPHTLKQQPAAVTPEEIPPMMRAGG